MSDIGPAWTNFFLNPYVRIEKRFWGEIRFGPEYFLLRSLPHNQYFNDRIFGDWLYLLDDKVLLQEWNSAQRANTNLITYHFVENRVEVTIKEIPSVLWEIIKADGKITLDCFGGYRIQYKIEG